MLEFIMPILNPEKPKRITLTMANTMFGALTGVRPVNWGVLIHEVVSRAIPYIGRKPSYLPPFILHLYQHYECATIEENLLTIAEELVAYKLQPVVADTSTSSDHITLEAPPSSHESTPPSFRMPNSPPPPSPHHQPEAAVPSRTQADTPWRNVDLSAWDIQKIPSSGCTMTWRISRPNIPD